MFKKLYTLISLFVLVQLSSGQKVSTLQDSIHNYFNEIKLETDRHKQLWGINLYGPILLVDPVTRQVFGNFSDTIGILKQTEKVFTGILPQDVNIANTATNWGGRRWAMIILPLPANKEDRINLLAHELFHVSQPSLGFKLFNIDNNHLDQKDGRIYLRLELEALKKAVESTGKLEQKMHLTNAINYRKYRHLLYPSADSTENLLELNEGMAEYTGLIISDRNHKQTVEHFVQSINSFLNNPTYVRSFAYQTTPIYGYFLSGIKKDWNKEINIKTNLTNYFIKEFNLTIPNDLKNATDLILNNYNGKTILLEEEIREDKSKKIIENYKNKFITNPHLEIAFEQMNVSFDPGNLVPIEDKGTVYPNLRITDNWGILTVKNGALISSNWDKVSVTSPTINEDKKVSGDGWILELKEGYTVTKNEETGNYKLIKK